MTVAQIEREMSARELAEWELQARKEPFGFALHLHQATLMATLLARVINVTRGKGEAQVTASDFLPYTKPRRPEPTLEQQLGWARVFEAMAKRAQS